MSLVLFLFPGHPGVVFSLSVRIGSSVVTETQSNSGLSNIEVYSSHMKEVERYGSQCLVNHDPSICILYNLTYGFPPLEKEQEKGERQGERKRGERKMDVPRLNYLPLISYLPSLLGLLAKIKCNKLLPISPRVCFHLIGQNFSHMTAYLQGRLGIVVF